MIWRLALNYDGFRAVWEQALREARLNAFAFPPTDSLDLGSLSRSHRTVLHLGPSPVSEPFHATASLEWTWDALQAARTATTEEDLLMVLLGQGRRHLDTEEPWLRVDVTLRATLPLDAPLPLPDPATWRRWVEAVEARLGPLLPSEVGEGERERMLLSWFGQPEAQALCAPDGRLLLSAVEVAAWQGISLPRHWDDPDRELDEEPGEQLVDLLQRVLKALAEWQGCLPLLLGGG